LLEGITFILDAHGFELHKKVTSPSLAGPSRGAGGAAGGLGEEPSSFHGGVGEAPPFQPHSQRVPATWAGAGLNMGNDRGIMSSPLGKGGGGGATKF
jgi:hypothetical protein